MGMNSTAVERFGADQVNNLQVESKTAVGDKIEKFDNIDIAVREALVPEDKRLLGGLGNFSDLLAAHDAKEKADGLSVILPDFVTSTGANEMMPDIETLKRPGLLDIITGSESRLFDGSLALGGK